jgi:hypothetical protein
VYVPAAGSNVGVEAADGASAVAVTSAVPVLLAESVAVSVATFPPEASGVNVTVVANEPLLIPADWQEPLVAAVNASPLVPLAAKLTVGPELQSPSFRIVVTFVAVEGVALTCAVGNVRLPTLMA